MIHVMNVQYSIYNFCILNVPYFMGYCFLQVLWAKQKPVPFLLRDLLMTPDITEVLGPTRVSAIFKYYPDL